MDVYEAMMTLRSMRRLKPDPVPEDLIKKILQAAVQAASGGNMQNWAFLVVRDPEKKRKIGEWYRDGLRRLMESGYGQRADLTAEQEGAVERTRKSAWYLADHMGEAPVLIFCCLILPPGSAGEARTGSSIYPAVQNLMLAARAEGLGATLTTLHSFHDDEVKELLGIPANVLTAALIPVGWPMGRFGQGQRKPLREVTYIDSWSRQPEW